MLKNKDTKKIRHCNMTSFFLLTIFYAKENKNIYKDESHQVSTDRQKTLIHIVMLIIIFGMKVAIKILVVILHHEILYNGSEPK